MADREREVLEKQIKCLSNLISTHKQLSAQEGGRVQGRGRWRQHTCAPVAPQGQARHRYTWSASGSSTHLSAPASSTHLSSSGSTHKLVKTSTVSSGKTTVTPSVPKLVKTTSVSNTKTICTASAYKLVKQTAPVSGHMTVTTATTGCSSGRPTSKVIPVSRPSSKVTVTTAASQQGSSQSQYRWTTSTAASGVVQTTAAPPNKTLRTAVPTGKVTVTTAASQQGSSQYRWTPAATTTVASGVAKRTAAPPNTALRTAVPPANPNVQKPAASVVKPAARPVLTATSVSVKSQADCIVSTKYSLKKVPSSSAQLSPSKTSTPRMSAVAQPPTGRVQSSRYKFRKTVPDSDPPHAHSSAADMAGTSGVTSSRYRLSKVGPAGTNRTGTHRGGVRGKTPSPKVLTSKHKLRRHPSAGRGSVVSKTSPGLSKKSPAGLVAVGKYKLRAKRSHSAGTRRGGRKAAGGVVSRYRLVKPDSGRSSEDTGTAKFPSQEQLRWTRSSSAGVMAEQGRVTGTRRGGRYVIPGTVSTPGLGRRVSRYKIIKSSTSGAGTSSKRARPDPRTARYYVKTASGKLLVKGGVVYKLSSSRLTRASPLTSRTAQKTLTDKPVGQKVVKVNIRGEKFLLDSSGKTLTRVKENAGGSTNEAAGTRAREEPPQPRGVSRVVIRGVPYIRTAPGKLVRSSATNKVQELASRAVQRSILTSQTARYRKTNRQAAARQFCMFYNRFGRCNRGNDCPYIHDPDKVAVCTRFLRGTCPVNDCPFSHKVAPDKMPVCSYFLRGVCNRDDCPYSHVYVSRHAQVCQDFVNGYCPRGKQDFVNGYCPRGKQCSSFSPHLVYLCRPGEVGWMCADPRAFVCRDNGLAWIVGDLLRPRVPLHRKVTPGTIVIVNYTERRPSGSPASPAKGSPGMHKEAHAGVPRLQQDRFVPPRGEMQDGPQEEEGEEETIRGWAGDGRACYITQVRMGYRPAEGDSEHQQESKEDCQEDSEESSEEEPPRKVAKLPSFISLRDEEPVGRDDTTERPTSQGQENLPASPAQPGSQSEGSRAPAEPVTVKPDTPGVKPDTPRHAQAGGAPPTPVPSKHAAPPGRQPHGPAPAWDNTALHH
ncbi:PREDICTED: zinc finger CCCH domain-containing protein 3-like [Branchiostoma belcheri]|uniref:Zinc finger CCCH domain-containing protein 3 n=1 Tax=Branchiostoma belcheri TaxID=7741 RepID=A0A6P5A507_BRABE|nr:PREDICTED: zinc finger CCCH domain-containing protein 3-like [Branchiostoma belcheri]